MIYAGSHGISVGVDAHTSSEGQKSGITVESNGILKYRASRNVRAEDAYTRLSDSDIATDPAKEKVLVPA